MSVPDLSVVVPAVNTVRDVEDCLTALDGQRQDLEVEVLLVNRIGRPVNAALEGRFPFAQVMDVDKSVTIPEMRALAFDAAEAPAIAVIEDHVIVPPGWGKHILDELGKANGVVAGSVENAATGNLMDWACFLCEYSHLIPPIDEGVVPWLTGNNVVYDRDLLEKHREAFEAGKWENNLHDSFKAAGVELICRPEIVVGHKKHYTFGEYMSQRYLYARSYAGARVKGESLGKKLFYGAAAFILPLLLFFRISKTIWGKGRHRGLLIKSLPLIALFVTSWGLGEVVGYWFGAGDSLAKVC